MWSKFPLIPTLNFDPVEILLKGRGLKYSNIISTTTNGKDCSWSGERPCWLTQGRKAKSRKAPLYWLLARLSSPLPLNQSFTATSTIVNRRNSTQSYKYKLQA
jgi:hypothetical protein